LHICGIWFGRWTDDGYHDGNRAAGVMEPRRHYTAQSLIGRQQRAIARILAVQLQRPTWHLCWKSIAAGAVKTRHSALAHHRRRIGPLRIVDEQYRELGTSPQSLRAFGPVITMGAALEAGKFVAALALACVSAAFSIDGRRG
jgi:hypothetical protein